MKKVENIILKPVNPPISQSKNSKIQTRRTSLTASVVCFGGGLLFSIGGLLFPFVIGFFRKSDGILGYAGTAFLIASLFLFGFCAHFMDKADDREKKSKKL